MSSRVSLLVVLGIAINAQGQDAPREDAERETKGFQVHVDFPGGSAKVVEIDSVKRLVRIVPTPHPERGWECWWYFRLSGITPGDEITVEVGPAPWATPNRATFSVDQKAWRQTEGGERSGNRITYRQKIDNGEAWFAWGPPFVPADDERLVAEAVKSPHVERFELCKTREGRSTPAIRVTAAEGDAGLRRAVWIQARQHAWESGSSWVAEGLTQWLTSDDPRAAALRERSVIAIVPIVDIDNVARGAGGKNQSPQDHNRDWSDTPHWRAPAAAIEEISKADKAGRFDLFVDLHNPGAGDREPYYYKPAAELISDTGQKNMKKFIDASKQEIVGPLKFNGRTVESGRSYDTNWRKISANWVKEHCREHVVAVTLETAWNTPHSTTEGYREVGRQLGLTIERYLRENSPP